MRDELPLTHIYNLARLGNAGDHVQLATTPDERGAIASWSSVSAVRQFVAEIDIKKQSASKFVLTIDLAVELVQSCVVSLEPVEARIARRFVRELHFSGPSRHGPRNAESGSITIEAGEDEEPPEEIESLHYDLARPVLEEYTLSLDPYPRAAGAQFQPESPPDERPDNPFAALKALKS